MQIKIMQVPSEISPVNFSPSKMKYSFPKARRFIKNRELKSPDFYDLPPTLAKRSASLGYGHKYDFTKNQEHFPGPNQYNVFGKLIKTKGPTLGVSRRAMEATGPFAFLKESMPGPGQYQNKSFSSPKFSIAKKLANKKNLAVPGPGAYESVEAFSSTGQYFISKYRNSMNSVLIKGHQKKIDFVQIQEGPGPGTYLSLQSSTGVGMYCLSKFKSQQGKSFARDKRRMFEPLSTPGPGRYRSYSEFQRRNCL